MSPEYIQALMAGANVQAPTTGTAQRTAQGFAPAQPQGKKKRNFWLDQLSTGASIAGGIGGSLVAPIAGTAAGAAIGGGLGEAIENIIDPQGGNWGNVGKEAALSGIMGAGPIKLLKGAGAGAKALATGADDVVGAASKVATTSVFNRGARIAPEVIENTVKGGAPLRTSATGKINAFGDKALTSQYGTIGKNVARETSPTETISQLANYGITKPVDAERIASFITGSNGILTNAVAEAANGAGKVSTSGVNKALRTAITENGLVDKEALSITNTVKAQLQAINKAGNEPSAILKAMRNLEKRAANLEGKGGNYRLATPERVDQANVLKAVRNELQDKLYTVGGANKNLQNVLTPELREKLVQLQPGNAQWQNFVDNNVMTATDLGALRSVQSPFVKVGKIIQEGADNSMTFGGRNSGFNGGTVANTVINTLAENVKNPAARVISKPLRNFGQPIANAGMGNQGIRGALGIGARLGATGMLKDTQTQPESLEDALMQDQSMGPNSFDANMMTNASMNNSDSMPNTANMNELSQTQDDVSSPFSPDNVNANIQQILANGGDLKDVKEYIGIVQAVQGLQPKDASSKPLSQGQQERADLIKALGLAEQTVEGGSINYGPVGSRLEGVKSMFNKADPETLNFKNTVSGLRAAITKARAGASLTAGELKMLAKYTPSDTDSEQQVRSKLAGLRQLYGYEAPAGGNTLEDALMQYSGQGYQ